MNLLRYDRIRPGKTILPGGGFRMRRGRITRAAIHERLEFEVNELRERLGGLPRPIEAEGIWREIWFQEAHNSTAIEGNTLILREVEILLREGRAVGGKELKDYLEVTGYASAAQWVYGQAQATESWADGSILTLTEVRHIHREVMTPVWNVAPHPDAYDAESPGNWRQHNIQAFGGGMRPPDHTDVRWHMSDWVESVNGIEKSPGLIAEKVARCHVDFERIHPFIDGNGRTGRLLTNLLLVRLGYPPAIIYQRDRKRYLAALQEADEGEIGPLGEIFARAILDNLMQFVVPSVAGPVRLVALEALTSPDLSVAALRAAASRGRLRAVRLPNGSWRSSRQWVEQYLAGRWARSS
jgi:Fic family protein